MKWDIGVCVHTIKKKEKKNIFWGYCQFVKHLISATIFLFLSPVSSLLYPLSSLIKIERSSSSSCFTLCHFKCFKNLKLKLSIKIVVSKFIQADRSWISYLSRCRVDTGTWRFLPNPCNRGHNSLISGHNSLISEVRSQLSN